MPTVTLTRQVTSTRLGAILRPGVHEVTEAEAAHYIAMGWTDQALEPVTGLAAKPVLTAIPADWRALHHLQRVRIAKAISGQDDLKAREADEIIAAEIDRRKGLDDAG